MKRPIVVKMGGEMIAHKPTKNKILKDFASWKKKGALALVHGGGPQIAKAFRKKKVKVQFVKGRRFTSETAMAIVEEVLSGTVNKDVVTTLQKKGIRAIGLSMRDGQILMAKPISGLGRAGKPIEVDPTIPKFFLQAGLAPVLSSVASDKKGAAVNVNADDAASALAISLKARNLIFLTDTNGVLDQNKKRIPVLKIKQIRSLISKGIISGGMIPKVQSAIQALKKGVGEVDILNGHKGINLKSGTRILK